MTKIIQKAEELFEKEQQFRRYLESNADIKDIKIGDIVSLISKAISIEEELKLILAERDPISLTIQNPEIKDVIKAVVEGKGLKCIEAYSILVDQNNLSHKKQSKIETLDFITDNLDGLFDIFHTQFDLSSYFQRKLMLGPIITDSSIPSDLESIFSELKEAYANGLNKTCVALCRMVIENSFSDVLVKNEKYNDALQITRSAKKKLNFEFGLFENINIAEALKIIPDRIAVYSHEIRTTGNKIIHSDRVDKLDLIKIIKKTIEIVETLYRQA